MKSRTARAKLARFIYSSENELASGGFHCKIFNFAFLTAIIFSLSERELMKTN